VVAAVVAAAVVNRRIVALEQVEGLREGPHCLTVPRSVAASVAPVVVVEQMQQLVVDVAAVAAAGVPAAAVGVLVAVVESVAAVVVERLDSLRVWHCGAPEPGCAAGGRDELAVMGGARPTAGYAAAERRPLAVEVVAAVVVAAVAVDALLYRIGEVVAAGEAADVVVAAFGSAVVRR
ncbi:hypothetical protein PENTCL1PPCAC_10414, partial [Pristionchus entomophagus]